MPIGGSTDSQPPLHYTGRLRQRTRLIVATGARQKRATVLTKPLQEDQTRTALVLEGKRRDAHRFGPTRAGGRTVTRAFTPLRSGVRRMDSVRQFIRDEEGQDVVEYGLLIATIAIVVLIGVGIFGSSINQWFLNLAGRITTTAT